MTDGVFARRIFDERLAGRVHLHCPVRAFGSDARDLSLTISDISSEGFMAHSRELIETGERIRVALPTVGTQIAQVGWAADGRIGCSFDQPLDRASYYELLAAVLKD